ncbi:MAG: hypothetical protein WBC44_05270 [Planctomycetaceae bacterium]
MTSPLLSDDRPSWRRVWLPATLVLASPWLATAVTLSFGAANYHMLFGSALMLTIFFLNMALALAGSTYGGLSVRGPIVLRVAVVIATGLYGLETYTILVTIGVNTLSVQL